MIQVIPLLSVIILSLFPTLLFGESSQKPAPIRACPDNLKSALVGLNNSLTNKKWINMDLDACPHIQEEILKDIDKVIESSEFDNYFALMGPKTMRLVRNAFFARKGYKFSDPDLLNYFMSYAWYKPQEKTDVKLTADENQKINLMKSIEDKWLIKPWKENWENSPPHALPNGVTVSDKGEKTLLKLREQTVDISPKTYGESSSRKDFFTVHGNPSHDAVLVCTLLRSGDSRFLRAMKLYSGDGKLMYNFDNTGSKKDDWINGLFRCPEWQAQRPNLLISYNGSGMSGAIWDTLVTFDATLKPIVVLNCGETVCSGTSFFSEVNEGNIYISVAARGGASDGVAGDKKSSLFKRINYDGSADDASGDKYINTWALWAIEKNGDLNKVTEITETAHDKPVTSNSWHVIIDTQYPTATLMAYAGVGPSQPPRGEIVSAVKFSNSLILYRLDSRHFGTTIIPLQ